MYEKINVFFIIIALLFLEVVITAIILLRLTELVLYLKVAESLDKQRVLVNGLMEQGMSDR